MSLNETRQESKQFTVQCKHLHFQGGREQIIGRKCTKQVQSTTDCNTLHTHSTVQRTVTR